MSLLTTGFQGVAISWSKRAAFTVLAATRWNGSIAGETGCRINPRRISADLLLEFLRIPNRRRRNKSRSRLHDGSPRQIARLLGAEEAARELIYHRWHEELWVPKFLGEATVPLRSWPSEPTPAAPDRSQVCCLEEVYPRLCLNSGSFIVGEGLFVDPGPVGERRLESGLRDLEFFADDFHAW